jgi:hypothetical protein
MEESPKLDTFRYTLNWAELEQDTHHHPHGSDSPDVALAVYPRHLEKTSGGICDPDAANNCLQHNGMGRAYLLRAAFPEW